LCSRILLNTVPGVKFLILTFQKTKISIIKFKDLTHNSEDLLPDPSDYLYGAGLRAHLSLPVHVYIFAYITIPVAMQYIFTLIIL